MAEAEAEAEAVALAIPAEKKGELKNDIQVSYIYGGKYGQQFSDYVHLRAGTSTTAKLQIRGGRRLDAIGIHLDKGGNFWHGRNGGDYREYNLKKGEYFNHVKFCQGVYGAEVKIFYAKMETDKKNWISAGTLTKECVDYWAPSGYSITGFVGREGEGIVSLGVFYTQNP